MQTDIASPMATTDLVSLFKAIYLGDLEVVKQTVENGMDLMEAQFVIRK